MGVAVLGTYDQLMDSLRGALETELDIENDFPRVGCRIQVACEWIMHSARPLLWWAQENIRYYNISEDPAQHYPDRPLYHGPPGICLQRRGFWQTRLMNLGKHSGLTDEIRQLTMKSAEIMITTERPIANTL
jgi:hypothetical protein